MMSEQYKTNSVDLYSANEVPAVCCSAGKTGRSIAVHLPLYGVGNQSTEFRPKPCIRHGTNKHCTIDGITIVVETTSFVGICFAISI
jgi:hypothetical protein